jgi:YD repeat-containing protein
MRNSSIACEHRTGRARHACISSFGRFLLLSLLLLRAMSALATSQCVQWKTEMSANGTVGATSGWLSNPQQACSVVTMMCSENPLSCGFNSIDYDFRNWTGTTQAVGWPGYLCNLSYQYKKKVAGFPSTWTDGQYQGGMTNRQNPVGCQCYVTAQASTPAQCGPTCNGAGDPISPASGGMYRTEADSLDAGALAFSRFYNSIDTTTSHDLSPGWRHSFSRTVTPKYSGSGYTGPYLPSTYTSSLYNDEALACTSGFAEIKARSNTWANATASYANGICSLNVGGTRIGTLAILYTSTPTPNPSALTLVGYDVTRDDGQLISFTLQGGSIVAPPSIGLKLQQTSSGYTLTDGSDNVETYDANGKLLSVTSPAGVVQTMTYDSSGRLGTVTDSFGHKVTLGYDTQNRLSSVVTR